jgi:AraC-like DNA-binding protein
MDDRASHLVSSDGRSLGRHWGVEELPSIVMRSLRGAEIAISDLRVNTPNGELSEPLPPDDTYMICLVLRDLPENSYWEEGRELGRFSLARGQTAISDMRRHPSAIMDQPIHTMLFQLPHATMNALADEIGVPRIGNLRFDGGVGVRDETIRHLGLSLLPAFESLDQVNRLFVDHAALALASHVASAYGGMQVSPSLAKGGLAPWQVRRAKDMIAADLGASVSLQDVAAACGLSPGHFSRAFRRSTGLAPHAWLLQGRVEKAKVMLQTSDQPLGVVAQACGFANQSHFTRVFARRIGLSPGAWRRYIIG